MIQYICGNPRACTVHADGLVVSPLDSPRSPGEFEINVVDLDDMGLWCHRAADTTSIDGYQDLVNLHRMIENNPAGRILSSDTTLSAARFDFAST